MHTLLALIDVLTGTARIPGELEAAGRASEGDQVRLSDCYPGPVAPIADSSTFNI